LKFPNVGSVDSLGILFTLLPGLITFVIVRSLTARSRKMEPTDAILLGLAYTLLVHAIWTVLTLASWIPTPDIVGLSLSAVGLGLFVSWLTNAGSAYRVFQWLRLTQESTWPSIWETAFREFRSNQGEYAVFEFTDGRRLYGAIHGFSADQRDGHILIDRAKWIHSNDENGDLPEQPGSLLIRADDVATVQFMPYEQGSQNVHRQSETTSGPPAD
jgi:hypothetical protein